MTNPTNDRDVFDSQDSSWGGGGSEKITCHHRLRLRRQTIFSDLSPPPPPPLNPSSQDCVTLIISRYLFCITVLSFNVSGNLKDNK